MRFFGLVLASAIVLGAFILWQRAGASEPHCACTSEAHGALPSALAPAALDGASLYQIEAAFTDQDDRALSLASLRGEPALVVMFYSSCTTVCPLMISELQRIEHALAQDERDRIRVVLVTIDPEHDTAERLRALAAERSLPTPRWTLLRTDEDGVRELAMALGVQYRRVGEGQFVHSALVTLLDDQGRIATQLDGVDARIDPLVSRAHELFASEALSPAP